MFSFFLQQDLQDKVKFLYMVYFMNKLIPVKILPEASPVSCLWHVPPVGDPGKTQDTLEGLSAGLGMSQKSWMKKKDFLQYLKWTKNISLDI